MMLAILGGGGFRVPLVFPAVLIDPTPSGVTHVSLFDLDSARLRALHQVVRGMSRDLADPVAIETTRTNSEITPSG